MGKAGNLPSLRLRRRAAPSSQAVLGSSAWQREPALPVHNNHTAFYAALCTSISHPQNGGTAAYLTGGCVSEGARAERAERLLGGGRDEYSCPAPFPVGASADWPATPSLPTPRPRPAASRAPSPLSGAQPDKPQQQQFRSAEHLLWTPVPCTLTRQLHEPSLQGLSAGTAPSQRDEMRPPGLQGNRERSQEQGSHPGWLPPARTPTQ